MIIPIDIPNVNEDRLADLVLQKLEEQGKVILLRRTKPYTVREAAEALNVSQDTIRLDIEVGRLIKIPSSGVVRIPAWAIELRQAGGGKAEIQMQQRRLRKEGSK